MKKSSVIFISLIMFAPALARADDVVYPAAALASPTFVQGAYNALDTAKQGKMQNNASTPADISSTVKTVLDTTVANASDISLVTEKAIATVLVNKVDTVVDATNTYSHPVVTSVTKSDGTVTVTKGEITIPVGSASQPSAHAEVWLDSGN